MEKGWGNAWNGVFSVSMKKVVEDLVGIGCSLYVYLGSNVLHKQIVLVFTLIVLSSFLSSLEFLSCFSESLRWMLGSVSEASLLL